MLICPLFALSPPSRFELRDRGSLFSRIYNIIKIPVVKPVKLQLQLRTRGQTHSRHPTLLWFLTVLIRPTQQIKNTEWKSQWTLHTLHRCLDFVISRAVRKWQPYYFMEAGEYWLHRKFCRDHLPHCGRWKRECGVFRVVIIVNRRPSIAVFRL